MGDRDPGGCRGGDRRTDARHDLERDACVSERLGFLAATAEDERIAALESHDQLALAAEFDEQCRDHLLGDRPARSLADVDALGRLRNERQYPVAHERIVDHDVGGREEPHRLDRQEVRIPRTCPHQRHLSNLFA